MRQTEFHTELERQGHRLKRDAKGDVDIFVCDAQDHNGPGCERCGENWCHHCGGIIKPCPGGQWVIHSVQRVVTSAQHVTDPESLILLNTASAYDELKVAHKIGDLTITLSTKEFVRS